MLSPITALCVAGVTETNNAPEKISIVLNLNYQHIPLLLWLGKHSQPHQPQQYC
jgi:hypothetical protein